MSSLTDAQKRARKAQATRRRNLAEKAKNEEKLKRAKARASRAEAKLKAFKEGVEFAVSQQNR